MDKKAESSYLTTLEDEAIYIIREVYAEFSNPVVLYSIGKDSSVLGHLVKKAFAPGKIPFTFLHIDTTFKFQEMYKFRDSFAKYLGIEIDSYTNQEGLTSIPIESNMALNGQPIDCTYCARFLKTEALKQALYKRQFDAAIGGSRRDEEKSRAKERVFSFRDEHMQWNPRGQRPELWSIYNTQRKRNESFRIFPISNWTELDVWLYIYKEDIPVVPLYLAKPRKVINRNGQLLLEGNCIKCKQDEKVETIMCRFRTLGCQICTGAIPSTADTLEKVINEVAGNKQSERANRVVDMESGDSSMERKKVDGYF